MLKEVGSLLLQRFLPMTVIDNLIIFSCFVDPEAQE